MKIIALILILAVYPFVIYADSRNTIHGTARDDHIIGSPDSDEILGGAGNDILRGGGGNDFLYGGTGADIFVVKLDDSSSFDTVMDFSSTEGDEVLFDFTGDQDKRKKYKIPKKLTIHNVTLDYKGNLNIKLTNNKTQSVLNIKQADLNIEIEDKVSSVHIRFKKKF